MSPFQVRLTDTLAGVYYNATSCPDVGVHRKGFIISDLTGAPKPAVGWSDFGVNKRP